MFEHILLADIVIADISFPNPNVYYELGLRHSTKSFATITIGLTNTILPFDIRPLKHILYDFKDGTLINKVDLLDNLVRRIELSMSKSVVSDSPIFQTIANYPGIDLGKDVIESFRDRSKANYSTSQFQAIKAAVKSENVAIIDVLAQDSNGEPELIFDLAIGYRDLKEYTKMINLISRHKNIKESGTGRELLAFALKKRDETGDLDLAEVILSKLIEDEGNTSERGSLLGSVHKVRYHKALTAGRKQEALAHLDAAVSSYGEAFLADPRDPYPGINYAVLLHVAGDDAEVARITPVLAFALLRRGGLDSKDCFDIATHIDLYILMGNKEMALRAARIARQKAPSRWMLETLGTNGEHLVDICDYYPQVQEILYGE